MTLKTGVIMLKIKLCVRNKLYFKIYSNRKQIFIVFAIFVIKNASLVSIRAFQKHYINWLN